ncbi:3-oxoacyl-ACP reductase family protein [Parapedobacter defluvii]|uniref:SDR family NAD(P)-dependent oxidoreductase n=1 Tax=Parapedobacter defluvii TaxID=2045106 RepID=UPI000F98E4D3|nr:MAG: 3-oxoacyl-ACP reductase FabG [Parapedobacter sp.]
MKLANKVAIVTGSSQSIGKGIALRFAKEGAKVVVNYLSNERLALAVVDEIRKNGGEAFAFRADVSNEDDVQRMVETTVARYGTVDILVNNAAIDPRQKWNEISVAEWDRVMANNVRSQFICCKAVYPYMQKQQYGKIINVSSVTFWFGKTNYVHYVASKGAIIGFTRALAREIGDDNITVNCITPGAIKTETELAKVGSVEAQQETDVQMTQLQSIPRRQLIGDLDGAFVFLASPDSDFITGQTLNVDGGWMMH